jgi:suppressor of ftsI
VKIRMHFNRFLGTYVFHCHILAHEDNGMMGIVDVSEDGQVSEATKKSLRDMADAMHEGHG